MICVFLYVYQGVQLVGLGEDVVVDYCYEFVVGGCVECGLVCGGDVWCVFGDVVDVQFGGGCFG